MQPWKLAGENWVKKSEGDVNILYTIRMTFTAENIYGPEARNHNFHYATHTYVCISPETL